MCSGGSFQQRWREFVPPQCTQKEEALLGLFYDVGGVHSPAQVLRDVQAKKLEAGDPFQFLPIDAEALVQCGPQLPEVNIDFFCLLSVEVEVAVAASGRQCLDLLFVRCLVSIVNEPHNSCIICKFDKGVGAMNSDTVISVQCVQDWTQHTALRNTSIEDDGGRCGGAHSDMLGSVSQGVLDPQTEGGSKL